MNPISRHYCTSIVAEKTKLWDHQELQGCFLLPIVSRSRAENHPAIIDKVLFDRVQELRLLITNMETDERGNRVRKSTHYSFCPKGSAKTQEE